MNAREAMAEERYLARAFRSSEAVGSSNWLGWALAIIIAGCMLLLDLNEMRAAIDACRLKRSPSRSF